MFHVCRHILFSPFFSTIKAKHSGALGKKKGLDYFHAVFVFYAKLGVVQELKINFLETWKDFQEMFL